MDGNAGAQQHLCCSISTPAVCEIGAMEKLVFETQSPRPSLGLGANLALQTPFAR